MCLDQSDLRIRKKLRTMMLPSEEAQPQRFSTLLQLRVSQYSYSSAPVAPLGLYPPESYALTMPRAQKRENSGREDPH